jgi:hypothetical protein
MTVAPRFARKKHSPRTTTRTGDLKPFRDLGGNYFDQRNSAVVLKRLLRRIENIDQVTLVPLEKPT